MAVPGLSTKLLVTYGTAPRNSCNFESTRGPPGSDRLFIVHCAIVENSTCMPKTDSPSKVSPTPENLLRTSLVDTAREGWTNRLIDLSRRNNLLYYKPTASTTLELPVTQEMTSFLLTVGHSPSLTFWAPARKSFPLYEQSPEKASKIWKRRACQPSTSHSDNARGPLRMADATQSPRFSSYRWI